MKKNRNFDKYFLKHHLKVSNGIEWKVISCSLNHFSASINYSRKFKVFGKTKSLSLKTFVSDSLQE